MPGVEKQFNQVAIQANRNKVEVHELQMHVTKRANDIGRY